MAPVRSVQFFRQSALPSFLLSCVPDYDIFQRWQMIAGGPQGSPEESPTPNGSMPRRKRGRGFRKGVATESVTENIRPSELCRKVLEAKVKRRGKSSPLDAQAARQENPMRCKTKQRKDSRSADPRIGAILGYRRITPAARRSKPPTRSGRSAQAGRDK